METKETKIVSLGSIMADKTDHRRRILEKATEKYLTLGYARVTMDDLAGELGMSKKTLYAYFPAKVDVLRAVVDNFIQSVIAEQDRILNDPALEFEARLSALLKLFLDLMSKINPPAMRDVQRAAPDVWDTIERTRQRRINKVFGTLLAEGQQLGYVRKDLDLAFVIVVVAATVREILNPNVLSRFSISLGDAFKILRSMLMGGILSDQGRKKFMPAESAFENQPAASLR